MTGAHPAVAALVASGLRSDRFRVIEVTASTTLPIGLHAATTVVWGATAEMRTRHNQLVALLHACPPESRAAAIALVWAPTPASTPKTASAAAADTAMSVRLVGRPGRLDLAALLQQFLADDGQTASHVALVIEAAAAATPSDAGQLDRYARSDEYQEMRPGDAAKALSKLVGVPRSQAYEAITRARDASDP